MSTVSSTSKTADKNIQQEIWKPVKEYEASYENGNVASKVSKIANQNYPNK